jgi:hypothetical protein
MVMTLHWSMRAARLRERLEQIKNFRFSYKAQFLVVQHDSFARRFATG